MKICHYQFQMVGFFFHRQPKKTIINTDVEKDEHAIHQLLPFGTFFPF